MDSDFSHIDFSKIFHQSSKDISKGHPFIDKDRSNWPDQWKDIYYKTYPRLPQLTLAHTNPESELLSLLAKRRSPRDFSRKPISKEELSILLEYSCGINDKKNGFRTHPSGGARFPIEVYPLVIAPTDEITAGLYHYNVKGHALEILWKRSFADEHIAQLLMDEWPQSASIIVILSATFSRTQSKYGERGYRYILLEAGHIGQNMLLLAEMLGLKACPVGTRDRKLENLLDIDGVTESVVYALTFGR